MAYNIELANKVRERLAKVPDIEIEEKKMFSGLSFLVNGKMCINISGDNLMCRYPVSYKHLLAHYTWNSI